MTLTMSCFHDVGINMPDVSKRNQINYVNTVLHL